MTKPDLGLRSATFGAVICDVDLLTGWADMRIREGALRKSSAALRGRVRCHGISDIDDMLRAYVGNPDQLARDQVAGWRWAREQLLMPPGCRIGDKKQQRRLQRFRDNRRKAGALA